jgi:hypothetical protein
MNENMIPNERAFHNIHLLRAMLQKTVNTPRSRALVGPIVHNDSRCGEALLVQPITSVLNIY